MTAGRVVSRRNGLLAAAALWPLLAMLLPGCNHRGPTDGFIERRYQGCLYRQYYRKGERTRDLTRKFDPKTLIWSDIGEGERDLGDAVERAGEIVSENTTADQLPPSGGSVKPATFQPKNASLGLSFRFYALDIGTSDRLVAMDADSAAVLATIPLDRETRGMVMIPRSGRLYILHSQVEAVGTRPAAPAQITEVDTVNLRIARKFPLPAGLVIGLGHAMEISPDGRLLYIANSGAFQPNGTFERSSVEVVEIASGQVVDSIPMPAMRRPDGSAAGTVAVTWIGGSPDGSMLWAYGGGRMVVVDSLSRTAGADFRVPGGGGPPFVFHPDGTRVYARTPRAVIAIDTATFSQISQIPLEGADSAVRMVITPDGFDLFVRDDLGGNLYRIDTRIDAVAERTEEFPGWVSFMTLPL